MQALVQTTPTTTEAETLTAEEVAALIADAPAEEGTSPEAFCPTDAAGVDWVLRKIAAARAEAKLLRENMEAMARACERRAEALEWKYGGPIQTYLRAELATGKGSSKSKRLPHGVIGYRPSPSRLRIAPGGEAAAVAWAKERSPEAVSERVDTAALRGRLQVNAAGQAVDAETGECMEWASVTPGEEVFYIR